MTDPTTDPTTDPINVVLTPNESTVHQGCIVEGRNQTVVAEEMGLSKQRIGQIMQQVRVKLELPGGREVKIFVGGEEVTLPEVEQFRAATKGINMDPLLAAAIERRYLHAVPAEGDEKLLRELNNASLLQLLEDRTRRMFTYFDDYAMARATGPQLAKMIESFVGLRQLLKGQPTSILAVDDRRKLSELAAALTSEIERRGKTIDVTPEQIVDVEPVE